MVFYIKKWYLLLSYFVKKVMVYFKFMDENDVIFWIFYMFIVSVYYYIFKYCMLIVYKKYINLLNKIGIYGIRKNM